MSLPGFDLLAQVREYLTDPRRLERYHGHAAEIMSEATSAFEADPDIHGLSLGDHAKYLHYITLCYRDALVRMTVSWYFTEFVKVSEWVALGRPEEPVENLPEGVVSVFGIRPRDR